MQEVRRETREEMLTAQEVADKAKITRAYYGKD